MDIHTRKLRYFVVLAEELHFSRAAARLFIAQQALSKQLQELEREIDATLLARSTRQVSLTPAGERFLGAARTILATLDAAVEDTRSVARREIGVLRVGFGVGAALELTAPIMETFAELYPGIQLELREYPLPEPAAGLNDGSCDVAFVRPPFTAGDVEFEPLFTEPRVAVVSSHHRLAQSPSISVQDIIDEPIALGRSTDAAWRRFWALEDLRDGRTPAKIRDTTSHTEEMELVAAGLAWSVTTSSAARFTPHANVRFIPIDDIAGSTCTVAWSRERENLLVDRFVQVARVVRDRERDLVAMIERGLGS